MIDNNKKVATELGLSNKSVDAVINLLDEGATVPFISRYRKEQTGSLDEVQVMSIRDRINELRELDDRRKTVLNSIEKQDLLTPALKELIENAETRNELEDIYLPYKPKRKTRATKAREKGLEPLAALIFKQQSLNVFQEAEKFIDEEEVPTAEEALQGAREIIAEWINENAEVRGRMRTYFQKEAMLVSKVIKGKEEVGEKFRDYFDWSELLLKTPSHRLLAMRRGEKEMILSLDISPDEQRAINLIEEKIIISHDESSEQVKLAISDCYSRLLKPSMETEMRVLTKELADESAINVFASNLRELLLASPLGQKMTLAIDPGFRTGCKVAVLDKQGKLLDNTTIYPILGKMKEVEAAETVKSLCEKFKIEAIAIGNGTASRETEAFVKSIGLDKSILILMVNESGASIYSASETAREEFPNHDITVRGAVSIGRRLMDPLAELVKIDPKSIGVGQYQHDVDQHALKKSLDDVVSSCVNAVGVELNTASKELLSYVSGLGPQLAKSIVSYRNENGPFEDRMSLTNVPRLGQKVFEQAAGFLRIRNGKHPLDASAVHPERYAIVDKMAKDLGCTVEELMKNDKLRESINIDKYVNDEVGQPTLTDIMQELAKPGRDPRQEFKFFSFQDGVNHIEDLKKGMHLPGIVTNVTNFGVFVDVGVHQDGLVHISHIADEYVSNPADLVAVQQQVQVTVIEVDVTRKRISLSMKKDPFNKNKITKSVKKNVPKDKKKQQSDKPQEGDMQHKLNQLKGLFNG